MILVEYVDLDLFSKYQRYTTLVDKVSGLIAIFQNPAIDFKSNRASGDDIIGDAYEYFMMKFAQESGNLDSRNS